MGIKQAKFLTKKLMVSINDHVWLVSRPLFRYAEKPWARLEADDYQHSINLTKIIARAQTSRAQTIYLRENDWLFHKRV